MSWLPGAAGARIDDAKVRDYLLRPGGGKVGRFETFGFQREAWQVLGEALCGHPIANPVSATVESIHGVKYVVECQLETPDGRNPCLTTVWIIDAGMTQPRFVTAY